MPKFKIGNPGGPGRKLGSRNKATLMLDAAAEAAGPEVLRTMARQANEGDVLAAKVVLEHLWRMRKGTFVKIDLPPVVDAKSLAEAHAQLIAETCAGETITLEQADKLSDLLERRRRALETVEIEQRLQETREIVAEHKQAAR